MQKIALIFFVSCVALGCIKSKTDPYTQGANLRTSNSSIRIYFLSMPTDLNINSIQLLTNSVLTAAGTTVLTATSPFVVPYSLVDKQGKARLLFTAFAINSRGGQVPVNRDTTIIDDPTHPIDYYLVNGSFIRIPRSVATVNRPEDIKIRVINFAVRDTVRFTNSFTRVDMFNTYGPVSLTYNDGSIVSPKVFNVAPGTFSDYAEVPYGTYQFKLFKNTGAAVDYQYQLFESGVLPRNYTVDTLPFVSGPQEGYSPVIRTFKPGGSYTVLLTPTLTGISADNSGNGPQAVGYLNQYRIVADNSPSTNYYFAKMQAVNVLTSTQTPVRFELDGVPMINKDSSSAINIQYAGQSTQQTVFQGAHDVKAFDALGNLLAESSIDLAPYNNYAAWLSSVNGKPQLSFSSIDFSGSRYVTGAGIADDGTNGSIRVVSSDGKSTICRFLNMSADVPYATFTNDNQLFTKTTQVRTYVGDIYDTLIYQSASVALPAGNTAINDPYISFFYFVNNTVTPPINTFTQPVTGPIRAYSSQLNPTPIIPGELLFQVRPVMPSDFIANPAIYTPGHAPNTETGVFTVALIGSASATDPTHALKFLLIRHVK